MKQRFTNKSSRHRRQHYRQPSLLPHLVEATASFPHVTLIAFAMLAMSFLAPLHVLLTVGVASLMRTRIREISIGVGPVLLRYRRAIVRLVIPLGGHCRFLISSDFPGAPASYLAALGAFDTRPRIAQAAVVLVPELALMLLSAAIIGPHLAWTSLASGFSELLVDACSPLSAAQVDLQTGATVLREQGILPFIAVFVTKFVAFHLLPVPPSNGWRLIRILLYPKTLAARTAPNGAEKLLSRFWLLLMAIWMVAITFYLKNS